MLAKHILSVLSLSSLALLTVAAHHAGPADLAERDAYNGADADAQLSERELQEREAMPCGTGNCPCTKPECSGRPKPKPKPKIYRGIDFDRQEGNIYARIILADSMKVGSPPILIDTKEVGLDGTSDDRCSMLTRHLQCLDYVTAGYPLNDPEAVDAVYNRTPLRGSTGSATTMHI